MRNAHPRLLNQKPEVGGKNLCSENPRGYSDAHSSLRTTPLGAKMALLSFPWHQAQSQTTVRTWKNFPVEWIVKNVPWLSRSPFINSKHLCLTLQVLKSTLSLLQIWVLHQAPWPFLGSKLGSLLFVICVITHKCS